MARLRLLVPLVLCLTLASTAPAAARSVLGDVPEVVSDAPASIAVTRSALVYGVDGQFDPYGVFLKRSDRDVRRLRQFDYLRALRARRPADADERTRGVEVAASETLVAVAVDTFASFYDANDEYHLPGPSAVAVSHRGGRARELMRCREASLGSIAADRDTVAFVGAGCAGAQGPIAVHDLARDIRRTLRAPRGGRFWDVRLKGPYLVAPVDGGPADGDAIVYDWRRGRELYRVSDWPVALQRDGKTATPTGRAQPGCQAGAVRWFSIPEPREHVIPGAACEDEDVLLAADRVVTTRFLAPPAEPGADAQSEAVIAELGTNRVTRLFPTQPSASSTRFAVYFDGPRVGYVDPTCGSGGRVVVDAVAELVRDGPPPAEACTVSLTRVPAELRVDRTGLFVLPLACRRGCTGYVRLWDPEEGRHLPLGGSDYYGLTAPRSRLTPLEVTLGSEELTRLRRRGRLGLELRVEILQIEGGSTTRAQPLTLLPPA